MPARTNALTLNLTSSADCKHLNQSHFKINILMAYLPQEQFNIYFEQSTLFNKLFTNFESDNYRQK